MKGVMIATPMYGGMCTGHYVVSLIGCLNVLKSQDIPCYWAQLMNESLITRARNELVRLFLDQTELSHLMFIDADIHFPSTAVFDLMEADQDVVCGIYPKKEVDWHRVSQAAREGHENLQDFGGAYVLNFVDQQEDKEISFGSVMEVRHGGTGFMMIKREVFEKLKDHVPTYRMSTVKNSEGEFVKPLTHEFFATSIDETGALLSEDYHFCDLWRKHGGKIYANPFIHLEHVGTYVYTGNLLRAGGNLK
jgi:hypothetical protein